ncbi:TonB-dependent receptor [Compostibacter hankyongensis]|uniref:TonB-dependent receptor n=2 Tax=Compostibacter hankyongensis TaxID=1007089 RepID=A0ABP8FNL7_9BACT
MAVILLLLPALLQAQQKSNIRGQIRDEAGNSLPGVTVQIKGQNAGTVTDPTGHFSLPANVGDSLVITFVGYRTRTVGVTGNAPLSIRMQSDNEALNEVVVVGYGTQKKVTVTGSVAAVQGTELMKTPTLNLSNSLAGRLPGVTAMQNSGEPGYDGSSIRIRGSNTLGNNDALIVIDGVPARAGGLERINPADIESMSVLKDASAAIYGARAANGVILITTKHGKTGKPTLTYDFNYGLAQATHIPKVANASQYAEMRNELEVFDLPDEEWQAAWDAFKATGSYTRPNGNVVTAPFQPEDFQKFKDGSDPWGHPNTDWYAAVFKKWSPQQRHNLQLSGGTDNFKYLASLGYEDQDAYYKNSATGYKQYDMRINLDGQISKWISTSLGITAREEYRFFPIRSASNIFRMLMRGDPTKNAIWPNGKPGMDIEYGDNPVVITTNETGYDRDKRYYVQTNGKVDILIPWVEGLKFTGTAAVDKYIKRTKRWETPWYLYNWDGTSYEEDGKTPALMQVLRSNFSDPRLTQGDEDQLNILLGGVFNYDHTFAGSHALNVLAGVNRETVSFDNFNAYRRYFISSAIDELYAGGDPEKTNDGGAWERARLNYFGRVSYNYKEKYLAEFLWRYDGSYMFPENTRFGFFPGVLAGWRISEESFWKQNVHLINYLKLRGSWGQMGNDQIYFGDVLQEYQYLTTYAFDTYVVGDELTKSLTESRVPNPFVTWEVANNTDIGIEGALLDNRISFEGDIFFNKRTHILWQRNASIPQTTGMTLPAENIGKVNNKGWELKVGYEDQAGDFHYSVSVNGGYAKNKIIFWDEAPGAPKWQQSTGHPMNTPLYYIYDGVFKDEKDIAANTLDYSAINNNNIRPGDMKYKDVNNDGKIDADDQMRMDKNTQPTFQGGLNINLQWRNFDASILFQGATGGALFLQTESGRIGNYLLDTYEHQWTVDNPSSKDPRIADRNNLYYSNGNTYWFRSTDYMRLKNVQIGYTLPAAVMKKAGIQNLRIYVSGLNLFTLDKLKVVDPESINGNLQYYPQSRILNAGLSVTF